MPKFSENQFSEMTGHTRATIRRKLDGLKHEIGTHRAKLYDSIEALQRIYGCVGNDSNSEISAAEATRRLTVKRGAQIDLEMEIARKDRIPIEVVEAVNDRVMQNAAGLLKSHVGKVLDETLIGDIFSEIREMGAAIKNG